MCGVRSTSAHGQRRPPDRRWLPVSPELQGSPTATGPLQATSSHCADTPSPCGRTASSLRALCRPTTPPTAAPLMKEVPAPRGRTCQGHCERQALCALSTPRRGRWMQTTYTELSLESNEALSLVRQSCPMARPRGDADPEPQAVARVRTPAFCLRLASMAHLARSRDPWTRCLRVQLRTVGKRMRGLPAMGARRTRCCCSTARATKPPARAERGGRGPSAAERADFVMCCAGGGGARARARQSVCDGRAERAANGIGPLVGAAASTALILARRPPELRWIG